MNLLISLTDKWANLPIWAWIVIAAVVLILIIVIAVVAAKAHRAKKNRPKKRDSPLPQRRNSPWLNPCRTRKRRL